MKRREIEVTRQKQREKGKGKKELRVGNKKEDEDRGKKAGERRMGKSEKGRTCNKDQSEPKKDIIKKETRGGGWKTL